MPLSTVCAGSQVIAKLGRQQGNTQLTNRRKANSGDYTIPRAAFKTMFTPPAQGFDTAAGFNAAVAPGEPLGGKFARHTHPGNPISDHVSIAAPCAQIKGDLQAEMKAGKLIPLTKSNVYWATQARSPEKVYVLERYARTDLALVYNGAFGYAMAAYGSLSSPGSLSRRRVPRPISLTHTPANVVTCMADSVTVAPAHVPQLAIFCGAKNFQNLVEFTEMGLSQGWTDVVE
jgi:hypothetical protein